MVSKGQSVDLCPLKKAWYVNLGKGMNAYISGSRQLGTSQHQSHRNAATQQEMTAVF